MNLPPLTPPSTPSGSSANGTPPTLPSPESVDSSSVPPTSSEPVSISSPNLPEPTPVGLQLPQVSEPSIAPFQTASLEAASALGSGEPPPAPLVPDTPLPTQQPVQAPAFSEPVSAPEPEFTPTSPLLENLQAMPSQPFQDPGVGIPSTAVPSEPPQATSVVPQESMSAGLQPASTPSATPTVSETNGSSDGAGQPPQKKGISLPQLPKGKGVLAIIAAVVLLVVGAVAAIFFLNPFGGSSSPGTQTPATKTTITYWGLWEPSEVMEPLIRQYESLNPGIDIVYTQQNRQQYRARMQTAVRGNNGPDIFRYHNTWMPMIKDDLATAPRSVLPATELQQEFYPVMSTELVRNNAVVGVPLMFEGMALLYNQSMLEAANALPPSDWREVRELAARLAIRTSNNSGLDRGGIALGTAENVDNSSDILALMMLQNSATPGNPMSPNAQTALEFYTLFSRMDGVWNATMPQSTVAFANEQVAMILVPSWRIHEIQKLNPNLRFGVTRLPQLSDERITWASYWVEGVSKNSKNAEESWKFLAWLSQPEQLRRLYSEAVKYRGFGELYPRVDMASELDDPLVQPYLEDALYAKSWPLASMTHDEGLNDQMIQYYTDAMNQMNRNGNAQSALEAVFPGIQQVLSRYGFSVTAPPAN